MGGVIRTMADQYEVMQWADARDVMNCKEKRWARNCRRHQEQDMEA